MDEKKPASPWDDLVEELGVDADTAALERRQPKTEIPSITRSDSDKPRQAPKAKPGDWNALAGSLGVEVPPSEEKQRKTDFDELPELRSEFDKALVESMDDSDVEDESRPETGMSGQAARTAFDALFAETASEWSLPTSAGNVLDTPLEFTEEGSIAGEFDSELEGERERTPETEESDSERPKRRRGRRRRGRGRGSRGGEGEGARRGSEGEGARRGGEGESARRDRPPREELTEIDSEDEAEGDEHEDEAAEEGDAGERDRDDRPPRKRSRRRGRGRGGRTERAPASARPTSSQAKKDDDDDDDDDDDEDSAADQQGGLFDLGDDDDDDSEDDDSGDEEGGRQKANHRNLPTWSEALGVIIDSNMAQRSKAPQRPSSPRGGRGRGGRGRKRN